MSYVIVLHGGAGAWEASRHAAALAGMAGAAEHGASLLRDGAAALDVVVEVVAMLEDHPLFNAGTGSALNDQGEAEMDASVMSGHDLTCGAVAALRRVRNPVRVARKVLEQTQHVLLAGEGALRFARRKGFDDYDPVTEDALVEHRRLQALQDQRETRRMGTVGALALDRAGHLAAATSTGGIAMKLAGRVGDSPIPGAGNYATADAASSATGRGELVMRVLATRTVCDLVAAGAHAQQAVQTVLERMRGSVGGEVGLIALSRHGEVGVAHGTATMPHAWFRDGQAALVCRMHAEE